VAQDSLEIALIKYNKKTWFKSALLGLIIGLAVIIPGISGSTVAIIFKLYDQFLYAIGNLFKKFKACFIFLLPIGLGVIVGVLAGFLGVKQLLELNLFAVVCLFAGLMSGAFPAVKDEIKGVKMTAKRITLFIVGLCIPLVLGCISAILTAQDFAKTPQVIEKSEEISTIFDTVSVWQVLLALVIGYAVALTQIVPGLSASALLMAIGWYKSILASASVTYVTSNPMILLVYMGLGIGFVLGLLTFSKVLTTLFNKARHTSYCMIVGLSLGSIISMFCNGDVMEVYCSWAAGSVSVGGIWLSICVGLILFAVGTVIAYLLVRYERAKAENTKKVEKVEPVDKAEKAKKIETTAKVEAAEKIKKTEKVEKTELKPQPQSQSQSQSQRNETAK
jgi:putative membrane protein